MKLPNDQFSVETPDACEAIQIMAGEHQYQIMMRKNLERHDEIREEFKVIFAQIRNRATSESSDESYKTITELNEMVRRHQEEIKSLIIEAKHLKQLARMIGYPGMYESVIAAHMQKPQ